MIPIRSIKSLYTLALAEGEGVGTAYEYYAKRLVLSPWLRQIERPWRILVAGLPEKYGASLDFLQLAAELGAAVTVVDERPQAIAKIQGALAAAQAQGRLVHLEPACRVVARLTEVTEAFDLCLSSEVLQRLGSDARLAYVQRLQELAPAVALFAPNAGNPAHTNVSGLSGLYVSELKALVESREAEEQGGTGAGERGSRGAREQPEVAHSLIPSTSLRASLSPRHFVTLSGYIDMPPFPPGVVRDEGQRARAGSGRVEALAMWALGYYARLEKFLPASIRQNYSHIIYALTRSA